MASSNDGITKFLSHNGKQLTPQQLAVRTAMRTRMTQQPRPGAGVPAPVVPGQKKQKPNDLCSCGSGKKYKKCCRFTDHGHAKPRDPAKLPKQRPMDQAVLAAAASTSAPADKNTTALALFNAGVDRRIVWAYIETGLYITEVNKTAQSPDDLERWEAALAQYDTAAPDERLILLAPALPEDFDESSGSNNMPDTVTPPGSESPDAGN